jgi:hypothetical protein
MHEREYKRLRATIEADYRKKLEALDLIYGMAARNGAPSASAPVRGELAQVVASAIQQVKGDFNVRDIEQTLKVAEPGLVVKRASLSNTLKRFVGSEIELVEKGTGKRASRYRRKAKAG